MFLEKPRLRYRLRRICRLAYLKYIYPFTSVAYVRAYLNSMLFLYMMRPEHQPVCILDHNAGGGANIYSHRRIQEYLREGRSVMRVVWQKKNRAFHARVYYQDLTIHFTLHELLDLTAPWAPRFSLLCVNEVYRWSLRHPWRYVFERNGRKHNALVGAALRKIRRLAQVKAEALEVCIHDYYAVCPRTFLVDTQGRFCSASHCMEPCSACFPAHTRNRLSLTKWRAAWQALFTEAERLLFFSESARNILSQVYQVLPEQVVVTPHAPLIRFSREIRIPSDGPMTIAVLGHLVTYKGSTMLLGLAEALIALCPSARIVLFGTLEHAGPLPENIVLAGKYQQKDLPDLIESYQCTIAFMASVCPETFSFTTQEIIQLGLPVVCFPLGAQEEQVRAWKKGRVAKELSVEAAYEALVALDGLRSGA